MTSDESNRDETTPLSLAPNVHSNPQLRAIHAKIQSKKQMNQAKVSSTYTNEVRNPVGAHTDSNWGSS